MSPCVCASSSIIRNAVKDAGEGDVQNVMHPARASALSCSLTRSPTRLACSPADQPPPHCNPLGVQLNQFSPQWLSNFHFRGRRNYSGKSSPAPLMCLSPARDRAAAGLPPLYAYSPAGPISANLFSHSIAGFDPSSSTRAV